MSIEKNISELTDEIETLEKMVTELAYAIRDLKEKECENSGENWLDWFLEEWEIKENELKIN